MIMLGVNQHKILGLAHHRPPLRSWRLDSEPQETQGCGGEYGAGNSECRRDYHWRQNVGQYVPEHDPGIAASQLRSQP